MEIGFRSLRLFLSLLCIVVFFFFLSPHSLPQPEASLKMESPIHLGQRPPGFRGLKKKKALKSWAFERISLPKSQEAQELSIVTLERCGRFGRGAQQTPALERGKCLQTQGGWGEVQRDGYQIPG